MASLQQVNEALGRVVAFLTPLMPLVGCHMVDFLTKRHWHTLLPTEMQQDLLSLPADALHTLPLASLPPYLGETHLPSTHHHLHTFLTQVHRHCPAALGMTTPTEQVLGEYGCGEISVVPMERVMSEKKTHEVEVMGQVIARLATGLGVDWLVDLGSGLGYLTSSLVLQYGQQVVAVDSSTSNTSSALTRNTRLKKLWRSLTQPQHDQAEQLVRKKRRRRKGIPQQQWQQQEGEEGDGREGDETQKTLQNTDVEGETLPSRPNGCFFGVTKFITEDTDLLEVVKAAVGSKEMRREVEDAGVGSGADAELEDTRGHRGRPGHCRDTDPLRPPPPDTTLEGQTHATNTSESPPLPGETTLNSITTNTTKREPPPPPPGDTTGLLSAASRLGLVGLHTCGNLASSSLRLFTSNPTVLFLCNVGCCYHLLEEEFSRSTYNQHQAAGEAKADDPLAREGNSEPRREGEAETTWEDDDGGATVAESPLDSMTPLVANTASPTRHHERDSSPPPPPLPPPPPHPKAGTEGQGEVDVNPLRPSDIPHLGFGFPLSTFLRARRFSLGRNTRMLSCQAADRITQGNVARADTLYWRALLQVVLEDKLEDVSQLPHVGRLSAKCSSFPEYVRKAAARLGVSLELTEEQLQEYDQRHSCSRDKLERFFLLRASLAAVVEGVVLLDRLAFLCEQEGVTAYLVPLFDPLTSPRSHALVAVRSHHDDTR